MNVQLALLWALFVEGLLVIWQLIKLRAKVDSPSVSRQAAGGTNDTAAERRMPVGT